MDVRFKLESTEIFTRMVKKSPVFEERFSLIDSPRPQIFIHIHTDIFLIDIIKIVTKQDVGPRGLIIGILGVQVFP